MGILLHELDKRALSFVCSNVDWWRQNKDFVDVKIFLLKKMTKTAFSRVVPEIQRLRILSKLEL